MIDTLSAPPTNLIAPPVLHEENQTGNWFSLPKTDPVAQHLTTALWDQEVQPVSWLVARLSQAAYIYCEETTGWKIVAKFYLPKTGTDAAYHAEREFKLTQRACKCFTSNKDLRSVQPLGIWEGVIFFKNVIGLTLENKIAIRRNQPGELVCTLETVGNFLSTLHRNSLKRNSTPDFGPAADYAYKLVDNLGKHGVLQNHPSVHNGLGRLIEKWATDRRMWDYQLALNHGDTTTTNFIFPPDGGVVAIDWERSEFADPVADLGHLMAEVTHSVNQNGGNFTEGQILSQQLAEAYYGFLPTNWNPDALLHRVQFYQATSMLRIARNGRLSRFDRLTLVLQAFALLSK
ncbi:MAG: aminoglycoside phosphotransferase family protein [Chloroflexota bacterium]